MSSSGVLVSLFATGLRRGDVLGKHRAGAAKIFFPFGKRNARPRASICRGDPFSKQKNRSEATDGKILKM